MKKPIFLLRVGQIVGVILCLILLALCNSCDTPKCHDYLYKGSGEMLGQTAYFNVEGDSAYFYGGGLYHDTVSLLSVGVNLWTCLRQSTTIQEPYGHVWIERTIFWKRKSFIEVERTSYFRDDMEPQILHTDIQRFYFWDSCKN